MPSQRRTPRGGPGGSRRPGATTGRPRARSTATSTTSGSLPAVGASAAATGAPRPRFTGRAVVLVLVLAVLAVSYASSMRAYLTQRAHISDLKSAIAEREASIDALEREKRRWDDPAYVRAQARERFGYLMPGETGFQVLDQDGRPLEGQAELTDPAEAAQVTPTPWWSDAWDSVELAGHPPRKEDEMARLVDGTRQQ
jgi:cell division protein FtsB